MYWLKQITIGPNGAAPLPTRYGDFTPLGRPAGRGGEGVSEKFSGKVFPKGVGMNIIA